MIETLEAGYDRTGTEYTKAEGFADKINHWPGLAALGVAVRVQSRPRMSTASWKWHDQGGVAAAGSRFGAAFSLHAGESPTPAFKRAIGPQASRLPQRFRPTIFRRRCAPFHRDTK